MATRAKIPQDVRRDWSRRLADAGYFEAALAWSPHDPGDRLFLAYVMVVSDQAEAALRLLGESESVARTGPHQRIPHQGSTVDPSLDAARVPVPDLAQLIAFAAHSALGDRDALQLLLHAIAAQGLNVDLNRLLVAAALPHDLSVAAQAALSVVQSGRDGTAREAVVVAVDLALRREFLNAYNALSAALDAGGLTPDAITDLAMALAGRSAKPDALAGVAALGAQVKTGNPVHDQFWKQLAARVVPQPRIPVVVWQLGRWTGYLALLLLSFAYNKPLVGLVVLIEYLWQRYVPLQGLDRETSDLVRSLREPLTKDVPFKQFSLQSLIMTCTGGALGLYLPTLLFENLGLGLLASGALGALAGFTLNRWVKNTLQRSSGHADAVNHHLDDKQCVCLRADRLHSAAARRYITQHLQEDGLSAPMGVVRRCPATGVLFIDLPHELGAVRVPDFDRALPTENSTGMYL